MPSVQFSIFINFPALFSDPCVQPTCTLLSWQLQKWAIKYECDLSVEPFKFLMRFFWVVKVRRCNHPGEMRVFGSFWHHVIYSAMNRLYCSMESQLGQYSKLVVSQNCYIVATKWHYITNPMDITSPIRPLGGVISEFVLMVRQLWTYILAFIFSSSIEPEDYDESFTLLFSVTETCKQKHT